MRRVVDGDNFLRGICPINSGGTVYVKNTSTTNRTGSCWLYNKPTKKKNGSNALLKKIIGFVYNSCNTFYVKEERSSKTYMFLSFLHVSQMEQAKQELSRKDSELLALRTKLETLNNQFSDSKQHVDVLKESLTAKEQRAAILQTEVSLLFPPISIIQSANVCFHWLVPVRAQVDALRLRLEEKESLLSKKSQQMSELTEEKSTQQGEITDLKDMLDVKERKVNVLQKKVGSFFLCNQLKF